MSRQEQLSNLQSYVKEVDKDITMILQNLQWDRGSLSKEQFPLSKCKYNENHKVSNSKQHEEMCFLKQNGYSAEDVLLPELFDSDGPTVVKFNPDAIKEIINNAAKKDPLFKRGCNSEDIPLSTERLQTTYTADERRAIHDAVVSSVRTIQAHDDEFLLLSGGSGAADGDKTRLERLAEQRDRRRRRTKYRAPPKTRNYSLVLRDVISTQMELLLEISGNAEVDHSTAQHEQDKEPVDIKKEIDENSKYDSAHYYDSKMDVRNEHKSRHHIDKHRHNNGKHHDRYTEHKHNKNKYYDGSESRRYYDKHNQKDHTSRNCNKTEDKRSKYDTDIEDTSRNYRPIEYTRERGRSRQDSSKDKNKYTDQACDKRYQSKDEFTKFDKKRREYVDEKYEGYTEKDRYYSSDRKKGKPDERHERERDRNHRSDYKRRKD